MAIGTGTGNRLTLSASIGMKPIEGNRFLPSRATFPPWLAWLLLARWLAWTAHSLGNVARGSLGVVMADVPATENTCI